MHNIQTLFWKTRQTQTRWFNDWTISSCNAVSESIISESVSISSSCSPFSVSVGFVERVPLAFGSAQSCERQPAPGPPPVRGSWMWVWLLIKYRWVEKCLLEIIHNAGGSRRKWVQEPPEKKDPVQRTWLDIWIVVFSVLWKTDD